MQLLNNLLLSNRLVCDFNNVDFYVFYIIYLDRYIYYIIYFIT